jgi:2,3-dihydro-2,3-dihydroxybenzoate dehydrogenase
VLDEDWRLSFSVNASGVMHLCRSVASRMSSRCRGSIVTVSSNATLIARQQFASYSASKAAAVAYTKCLGLELAPRNIRCNVVSPGSTETRMLRQLVPVSQSQRLVDGVPEEFRTGIPLGRLASAGSVAKLVIFLLSDEAEHITLANVSVDGGASLGA